MEVKMQNVLSGEELNLFNLTDQKICCILSGLEYSFLIANNSAYFLGYI